MSFLRNTNIESIVELASTDTLSQIAHDRFGDTKLWRSIADANEEYNIFSINEGGVKINVPSKEDAIAAFKDEFSDEISSVEGVVNNTIGKVGKLPHQVIDWVL